VPAPDPGVAVRIGSDAVGLTVQIAAMLAVLGAFASLAVADLRAPGLYYDELIQVVPALAFVRGGLWSSVNWLPSTEISLFGRDLPLMTMPYIGALKTVVFIPVVALAGVTPESVRMVTVALGACSLLATFAFARRLFGAATALLTVAFLATDLSFVYYVRIDYGPTALMTLLKAMALWQLTIWWQEGRVRNLAVGALALGLGVYDKANFLWIVAGIGGAALLVAPRALRARTTIRSCLAGGAAFVVGAAPLIYYNAAWPMPTWVALSQQATTGAPVGGFGETFLQRLGVLEHLVDGGHLMRGASTLSPTTGVVALLVAAGAGLALARAGARQKRYATRPMFVLVAGVLILVAAAETPGGFAGHHMILAYPFPHLLAAAALMSMVDWLRRRIRAAAAIGLAALITVLAVGQNWLTTHEYLDTLRSTGGTGNFSDAIYDVAGALDRKASDAPVVELDWGLHFPLLGLSQGRIHSVEVMDGSAENLRPFLVDPGVRYVAHAAGAINFPRGWQAFTTAVDAAGLQPVREERFASRDGQPVIDVYVVRRPAGAPSTLSLIGAQGRGTIAEGGSQDQVRVLTLPQTAAQALVTVATSRTAYAVIVPEKAQLRFAVAQPDTVWQETTGAIATVTLVEGDRTQEIFRRRLSARDVVADRAWSDVSVDLSSFAGQPVHLEFAAEPPPEGNNASWVIWRGLLLQWPEQ
jgi:4-amino-4-deoxy-L-arabinose transferase-like glycosyltransferase